MDYQAMTKHIFEILTVLATAGLLGVSAVSGQEANDLAPAFSLQSIDEETHSLEQYQGKYVVLEWMNFRCRTVDQKYKDRSLPDLQLEMKDKGIVWLSIVSEAQGKQGQVSLAKMQRQLEKRQGNQDAVLLDPMGTVGRMYEASVSPHVVLIGPEGELLYQGAIDNEPAVTDTEEPVVNYLEKAFEEASSGQSIEYALTEAYGCPIRYDN